jgi:PAS domain S-box-containing protein
MFGYEHPADLIGQQALDHAAPHERSRIHAYAMARLRGESIPARYEYQGVRQDGTRLWIERIASLIPWAGETVFLSTYVDITERKQAEVERERFIAELEAKNAELERFTYTVSHDLKSPLVTIQGFLGLLEQDALAGDGAQLKEDITQIATAAETMWHLLEDLLALSRIGRVVNPPQAVAFGELVHEAIALVSGQITRRGVQVEVAPDLPVVWGDRPRLLEVLQNLLDNAVKFMGDQAVPRLQIGVRYTDAEMIVYVRDNGLGIAPRYHEKVFGLFERLDTASDGTGVGLALVKRIVELHGGRIWIESAGTGHGCTVCFTLPRPGERAHHEP